MVEELKSVSTQMLYLLKTQLHNSVTMRLRMVGPFILVIIPVYHAKETQ